MLAIGRALMTNPKLLILDEATEGLAPVIRAEIWATLAALPVEHASRAEPRRRASARARYAPHHYLRERLSRHRRLSFQRARVRTE
jgi:branched-chain amino acid transport system ATP-binding protein